jgi:hypothetical protein
MSIHPSLPILLFLALTSACMTSVPERETTPSDMHFVSSIKLTRTVGSVGEKFVSELALLTRRQVGETEIKVRSLPPGLLFDESEMAITGVPEADGFFSVTIAIRKKRGPGIHFATPQSAWYSERLDIDIYRPIEDGESDLALNDSSEY